MKRRLRLRLFVSGHCPKCPQAESLLRELVRRRHDVSLEVLNVDEEENLISALMLQIASTPSLVINDTVVCRGYVPSTLEELEKLLEKYVG